MKGIIIAGGLGTRLRPLTYRRPKPLVPVVNRPFLEYQVALLRQHGVDDIVFATNYMADRIEAHFGSGERFGVRMQYAIEDNPLGTGGAIRNAADLFPGEAVAVFNGDVLTDFDIGAVIRFHTEKRALATITLAAIPRPNPFGVLILDAEGRVREWREPSEETKRALAAGAAAEESGEDLINAGFYVLDRAFIDRIPSGVPRSVERDIYPQALAEGAPVYGIAPGGFWMDLGRPEQLMAASQAVLSRAVRTSTQAVAVAPTAQVQAGATVDALSSVGAGSKIGEGSRLERSIVMEGVTIGANVRLRDVVIDDGAEIEEDVVVTGRPEGPTPVISAGSIIRRGARLHG